VNTALLILLGILVAGAVGMQVWIVRSTSSPDTAGHIARNIRIMNVVLLVLAVALAVYFLMARR
jgi:hypothetical protein